MKLGLIGLGQMGHAMAANLIRAGHELVVWNRSPGRDEALLALGARRAATPAEAAGGDVVLTMLADDAALHAVVFGADGIAAAPALHLSHSTISPTLADAVADAQGDRFVSAPVFGRPPAAEAAKLFVVAAGPAASVERCAPIFDAIGQRVFMVGERPALANIVKLSGNFMIMAAVEAMAEAMTLAEANGVDRAALLTVLTGTLFDSPVYHNYGAMLVDDAFAPAGFPAPLGLKDMTLVDAAADAAQVAMPTLGIVRRHLLDVIANDGPEVDWSAIALAVRRGAARDEARPRASADRPAGRAPRSPRRRGR